MGSHTQSEARRRDNSPPLSFFLNKYSKLKKLSRIGIILALSSLRQQQDAGFVRGE
jgi:hypothetical protein